MTRILLIVGILVAILLIYAIVDLSFTSRSRIRGIPKPAWYLVILLPVVGPLLWITVGKSRSFSIQSAPDDDQAFLDSIGISDYDEDEEIVRPGSGGQDSDGPDSDKPDSDEPGSDEPHLPRDSSQP